MNYSYASLMNENKLHKTCMVLKGFPPLNFTFAFAKIAALSNYQLSSRQVIKFTTRPSVHNTRLHNRADPTGKRVLPNHGVDNVSVFGSIANSRQYLHDMVSHIKRGIFHTEGYMDMALVISCGQAPWWTEPILFLT